MRHIVRVMLIAAVYGCGDEAPITQPVAPKASVVAGGYGVVKLPTLFGVSRGMAINSQGWVAGWSTREDGTRRAVLWREGSMTAFATLGGPSSTVPWPGLNDHGMVVGISQSDEVDPLDEDWSCEGGGFLPESTNLVCLGFFGENGVMQELPTLGGHHGFAAGVNNRGQIVGWAETADNDETCNQDPQMLGFRAVLWEPKSGTSDRIKTTELLPLPGHTASAATAINDDGIAVGISGECDQAVGRFSALEAVLWQKNGKPITLPHLGGTTWHTPMDINAQGDVVGFSNPAGPGDPEGDFISQAFLWINGADEVVPIGTLGDDAFSEAFAINSHRQVVGISFGGSSGARAFLYEDGELKDLNDLIEGDDVFLSAQDINDAGQITGRVRDAVTGATLAFVATPIPSDP